MKSSDHGIHAASIGGMWQCVVYGFGGVRMLGGNLRINPNLPKEWDSLNFPIYWQGERLEVTVNQEQVRIERPEFNGQALNIEVAGEQK
ncbi:glycosyl hydrolase family 65 protein [Vibrio mexicanus]|uniref:glycosyl hydrolase family 65 protein n=1 Tax=Vibrio mexicanus TaxID=1004326 RepID=UPI003B5110D6